MRKLTNDQWSAYHPSTNKLWIEYLLDKLKRVKTYAKGKSTTSELRRLTKLKEELQASATLEEWFVKHYHQF